MFFCRRKQKIAKIHFKILFFVTIQPCIRPGKEPAEVYLRKGLCLVGYMALSHKRGFSCVSSDKAALAANPSGHGWIVTIFCSYSAARVEMHWKIRYDTWLPSFSQNLVLRSRAAYSLFKRVFFDFLFGQIQRIQIGSSRSTLWSFHWLPGLWICWYRSYLRLLPHGSRV